MEAEDEDSVVHKKKIVDKKGTDCKRNEVRGESNQENEEQIMVKNKELKDQEKEKTVYLNLCDIWSYLSINHAFPYF